MDLPILLIVTARDCPHCTIFLKDHLRPLKKWISETKKVSIELIENKSRGTPFPSEYGEIRSLFRWYPMFFLMPRNSWERKKKDYVVVRGGSFDAKGIMVPSRDRKETSYDAKELIAWIEKVLSGLPWKKMKDAPGTSSITFLTDAEPRKITLEDDEENPEFRHFVFHPLRI